jgi:hypothetical protein
MPQFDVTIAWAEFGSVSYGLTHELPPEPEILARMVGAPEDSVFRYRHAPGGPNRHEITWQAPMADTFHVPERFGLLELTKKN